MGGSCLCPWNYYASFCILTTVCWTDESKFNLISDLCNILISGNLHFYHWAVPSTFRTLTLCRVDSRYSNIYFHLYYCVLWLILFDGIIKSQRRDVYGAREQYLGLEHSDTAPKRSYTVNQVRVLSLCYIANLKLSVFG